MTLFNVRIGDSQLIATAVLQDIRDARIKSTWLAGDFLVNHVGDLVRGAARLRCRNPHFLGEQSAAAGASSSQNRIRNSLPAGST